MKIAAPLRAAALALAPLLIPLLAPLATAAADAVPTIDQATALAQAGKQAEALHAFETIIASHPANPAQALFAATNLALSLNDWRTAQPYAQQLVKLYPGSMEAWELMVQVDQAAGAEDDEKLAIDSMYSAWRSALDPAIHQRVTFARDRIFGPKRAVMVTQTLEPGGEDILLWVFRPITTTGQPSHYLIVHSDGQTNQQWRDTGTISYSQAVYHLDEVVIQPDGSQVAVPYKFFIGAPDYATVRKVVVDILNGQAKPQVGDPDPYWTTDTVP